MHKIDFFKNLVEFVKTEIFSFLLPDQNLDDLKRTSGGMWATYPWVVDLEDEDVTPVGTKWMEVLPQVGLFSEKYKTAFFKKGQL